MQDPLDFKEAFQDIIPRVSKIASLGKSVEIDAEVSKEGGINFVFHVDSMSYSFQVMYELGEGGEEGDYPEHLEILRDLDALIKSGEEKANEKRRLEDALNELPDDVLKFLTSEEGKRLTRETLNRRNL